MDPEVNLRASAPYRESSADTERNDVTSTTEVPVATLEVERRASVAVRRSSVLGTDLLAELGDRHGARGGMVALSPTIDRLYGDRLRAQVAAAHGTWSVTVVGTGESNKTPGTVEVLLHEMSLRDFGRTDLLVGIGGGVLLDVVGVAASQYRRGVPHVKVGTTLLAQVDAAVSVKCGVNFGAGKNLLGAFHAPIAILVDGRFLNTVAARDVRCGLAEVLKLAMVSDAHLFDLLVRRDHR